MSIATVSPAGSTLMQVGIKIYWYYGRLPAYTNIAASIPGRREKNSLVAFIEANTNMNNEDGVHSKLPLQIDKG